MVKLTFILLGIFIIIHFTLYYWNIDPFCLYQNPKTILVDVEEQYDFGEVKNNLEDCLNELKQYNSISIKDESY